MTNTCSSASYTQLPDRQWELSPDFHRFLFNPAEQKSISFLRRFHIDPSKLEFSCKSWGAIHDVNPEQPIIDSDMLLLPRSGLYVGRDEGRTVLFLAWPKRVDEKVDLAFNLITNSVTGRPYDNFLSESDISISLFNVFLGTPPLHYNCEPTAKLLECLLGAIGVYSRCLWWVYNSEEQEHRRYHVSLEAFLPENGAWQVIDAHYGLLFQPGFSALAFALTDWQEQKPFLRQIVDKDFYDHSEFETYNHATKLVVLRARSKLHIGLKNPNVSDRDHLLAYASRCVKINRLAQKDFCYSASYEGTSFMPYQYHSKLLV